MRSPQEKIFKKEVEGIGTFLFKYLNIRENIAVENATAKLLDYNPTPNEIAYYKAKVVATLEAVVHKAPEGWSIDDCYEFDDLAVVFAAYSEGLNFFRDPGQRDSEEASAGDVAGAPVLVPAKVQSARNRPAHS